MKLYHLEMIHLERYPQMHFWLLCSAIELMSLIASQACWVCLCVLAERVRETTHILKLIFSCLLQYRYWLNSDLHSLGKIAESCIFSSSSGIMQGILGDINHSLHHHLHLIQIQWLNTWLINWPESGINVYDDCYNLYICNGLVCMQRIMALVPLYGRSGCFEG